MIEIFLRDQTILKLPMSFGVSFCYMFSASDNVISMSCIICGKKCKNEVYYTIKDMTVSFCENHQIDIMGVPFERFETLRMRKNNN